ncbi:MAG TPA: RnfABCDGE type electron transport complex subunit D [Candidatus Binatia bacterium]|nr:RnfABCDGE type electron transport complex subunit D [Candidatus Binatia bacterium]
MFSFIDRLLERITMYKLLFYYLIALVVIAFGLSLAGILHFGAGSIAVSVVILVVACWVVNKVFAEIFQAPTNVESVYITALILVLIIPPTTDGNTAEHIAFLLAASGLAMASKYILTINKNHIFNPAAIAVALTALGPRQSADWWIGTSVMLPYVLIGGILLVRKIRRGRMVSIFFISTLAATVIYSLIAKQDAFTALRQTLTTSAMFFLGFVMLTEPMTTPPTAKKQTWYAILTGVLFPPQFHIFSLYSTPELALIASNAFSYVISPKIKLFPALKQKLRITPDSVDFVFNTNKNKFAYEPGQYMEWTLPHNGTDSRGNRRYFTLASSPTEEDIRIGVKFYDKSSSYKEALMDINRETKVVASQVAGDFVLPKDPKQKLVFIAGGIGVTPYRSMVKYLLDTKEKRTITMLYSAKTTNDFAYKDIFEQARRELDMNTLYIVTDKTNTISHQHIRPERINAEMIKKEVPDYQDRVFYISGTRSMVNAMQEILANIGVPGHQVKADYFSGYA